VTTLHRDEVRPKPSFIRMDSLDASLIRGMQSRDISQYLKITKLTIQLYLEACLREDGIFRELFKNFASFSTNYVVNKQSADQSQQEIQISRYSESMGENMPQMIIQDNGYKYEVASLGGLTEGWNTRTRDGVQIVRIMDVITIPITITCATMRESSVEDLTAILSFAFGQFQKFTCNYILNPDRHHNGVYWEVRIPFTHQMSGKTHSPIHGDPRAQIWQTTLSMDTEFENSTYLQYRAAPRMSPKSGALALAVPDKVPLARLTPFTLRNIPFPIKIYSNDSRIALVATRGTHWVIQPKQLGTFKILVVRTSVSTGRLINPDDNFIIAEKEVRVVAR